MQPYLTALLLLCLLAFSFAAPSKQEAYQKRVGKKYLDEVASKEGAVLLKSGMVVEILKTSDRDDAKSPRAGDACEVTYLGTFKDGTRFDGGTTSFAPNQVIKGWTEAMQLMAEGDKWKLHIPYQLAYGERGSPPKIPGFSVLVFEIEIHAVKGGKGKPKEEARAAFQAARAEPELR
jgi:FKBP-type peptidyl-prolyl cis-trans isomerase FklB